MTFFSRLRTFGTLPHLPAVSIPESVLRFLFEVSLIGIAVFLGLLANQWREHRQHRELAAATLRYFRRDATVNQQALLAERQYHQALAHNLETYLSAEATKTRDSFDVQVHFQGLHPIVFEHTAWDLALATQSLSDLPPPLAYALSRVYTRQQAFQALENSFLQSMYSPATFASEDARGMATAMDVYLTDVNLQEPALLKLYDDLLPQLDRAQAP